MKRLTTQEFIQRSKLKFGEKYDYSLVNYVNNSTPIKIICPIHGEFIQVPAEHLISEIGCKKCSHIHINKSNSYTQEEFIKKCLIIHNNKYDYSKTIYIGIHNKIIIICPTHGDFLQNASGHLHGQGCKKCGIIKQANLQKYSTNEFIEKSNQIHNFKYNYSKSNYINSREKIEIICPIHGIFLQSPQKHLSGHGCRKCANIIIGQKILLSPDVFFEKAKIKYDNKYDYSKSKYKNTTTNIEIICPIHGSFWQTPLLHLNRKHGCLKCSYVETGYQNSKDKKHFLNLFSKVHGNKYTYSENINPHYQNKIEIFCPIHGNFKQLVNNHLQGKGCPKCSISISKQEIKIQDLLKQYNITFIEKDRNQIKPLELDIFIPSKNLAFEINGIFWHSELCGKDKNYHLNKTNLCNSKNIRLIQILETELKSKPKIVIARLKNILGLTKYSIYARKCTIKEIDAQTKNKFLNKYHLQGEDKSSIKLGLFYRNKLVEVMTFSKLRLAMGQHNKLNCWELCRFAGLSNFSVIGGSSKLLTYFERQYKPNSIISYADLRWSNGNLYNKLNFKQIRISQPNYWYFQEGNNPKLYHRFNFRKQELFKKLKIYDQNLTEWENMKLNKWNRIWDCGNLVFEKIYPIEIVL